jgi:hypothetical protein
LTPRSASTFSVCLRLTHELKLFQCASIEEDFSELSASSILTRESASTFSVCLRLTRLNPTLSRESQFRASPSCGTSASLVRFPPVAFSIRTPASLFPFHLREWRTAWHARNWAAMMDLETRGWHRRPFGSEFFLEGFQKIQRCGGLERDESFERIRAREVDRCDLS